MDREWQMVGSGKRAASLLGEGRWDLTQSRGGGGFECMVRFSGGGSLARRSQTDATKHFRSSSLARRSFAALRLNLRTSKVPQRSDVSCGRVISRWPEKMAEVRQDRAKPHLRDTFRSIPGASPWRRLRRGCGPGACCRCCGRGCPPCDRKHRVGRRFPF